MKITLVRNIFATAVVTAVLMFCGCGKKDVKSYLIVEGKPGRVLKINRKTEIKVEKNLQIQLSPGNHLLEMSAPGYETSYQRIQLGAGKKLRFAPDMKQIISSVLIESNPAGAKVLYDGSVKGTTPIVLRNLTIGAHKAMLEMPGYAKREISWNVTDARPLPKIKVSLDSNTIKVKIFSIPEGAQVYVDDIPVGITPFEGNFETGLHLVKLSKQGFVEHIDQINLKRSKPITKKYAMRALPGTLKIVSSPAGAIVSLNGKKRGVAPLSMELDAGKYSLKLEKDGFDPTVKNIVIAPAQNEEMVVNLNSATGSARFMIFPGNVAMKLDGKDKGKVPASGDGHREVNFRNLSPGTHILELTHPMAKPSTRRFRFKVEKGKTYQPDNPIEIWIANCEVTYLDGRKEKGALYHETPNGILFGPTPKIKFEVLKSQIKRFRRLPEE